MGKTQIALLRLKPRICKAQAGAMRGDGGTEVRMEVGEAATFPEFKGFAGPALLAGSAAPSLTPAEKPGCRGSVNQQRGC